MEGFYLAGKQVNGRKKERGDRDRGWLDGAREVKECHMFLRKKIASRLLGKRLMRRMGTEAS